MKQPSRKYELAIIGAGMAGMAAAVFAANRGISTVIIGSLGESWFTSGLIDLMGIHPIESGKRWRTPWTAIKAVTEDIPGHPYARLRKEDMNAALQEFWAFLSDAGLHYCFNNEQNANLITAFGAIKTTYGVPQTMWPGVEAFSQKSPCLIVDLQGLKGFSARLLSERLKPEWHGLKTLSIASIYNRRAQQINPIPLAHDLEIAKYRQKFAELIRPHTRDVEFIGLPAILGIHQAEKVVREFAELLGKPVFEIPAMPPSIPGIRLKEAFLRHFPNSGIHCMFQKLVLKVLPAKNQDFLLDVGQTEHETTIRTDGILLATGRFLGGGLQSDHTTIKERLFNLPVSQPEIRKNWHNDSFFDPSGHAINKAGLEIDDTFRPLNANGGPAFEKLFAAGIILANQDWTRMKCGSGLSIATAYGAIESFSRLRA